MILYGDLVPLVYARSIIPELTASKGYPGLGAIGSKPLGDLLFKVNYLLKYVESLHNFKPLPKKLSGEKDSLPCSRISLKCHGGILIIMNKALAIFELMRLDKPIGIYLLLWPALLALVISTNGDFEYTDLFIVIAGSILVRSTGCVINDIWDKDLDGGVERTKQGQYPAKSSQYLKVGLFLQYLVF